MFIHGCDDVIGLVFGRLTRRRSAHGAGADFDRKNVLAVQIGAGEAEEDGGEEAGNLS